MAIPSKQIGWSEKANLLWNIAKQFEKLTQVAGNIQIAPVVPTTTTTTTIAGTTTSTTSSTSTSTTSTTTTIEPTTTTTTTDIPSSNWNFVSAQTSIFPANSDGYTLYTGAWTNFDDGQTVDTFPLGGDFYTNSIANSTSYLSTNGYMIPFNSGFNIFGNNGDLYLTPGSALNDGDTQNFWYQNTVNGSKWRTSMLIYCGLCCGASQQIPYSYILRVYRDSQYQYIETCVKTNVRGSAGPTSNTVIANTLSQVWQSDLNGNTWTYLGLGYISDGSITTTTTTTVAPGDNFIATETNDELITENGNNLIINYPLPTSEIITEDGNFVITENGDNLTTQ